MSRPEVQQLPPSDSHRLVPIESFALHPGIVAETWILTVEGTVPCANMNVTLEPAVYIRQPEWWRIEAVGTVPGGICLPATRPYAASLPLAGSVGTKGIELVGEGFSQQIAVPPASPEPEAERVLQVAEVSLAVLESMPRQLRVSAMGTASTPGWTDPRLVLRPDQSTPDADGILHLDFVAERPEGIVLQVLVPIAGTFTWTDFEAHAAALKGVQVHARTNAVTAPYSEGPTPGPNHQEQVDLPLHTAVEVDGGSLSLTLVGVEDSRCPSNVVCVWQGFVTAKIEATPRGGATETVTLSSLDTTPAVLPSGHRLSLVNVMPYPIAGVPPAHPPVATVVVMRP